MRSSIVIGMILSLIGVAGCGGTGSDNNGIDESAFATNSTLRASLSNVVAVHLEHPLGGPMPDDTGSTGDDLIPYRMELSGSAENIELCFSSEAGQSVSLLDADRGVVQTVASGDACAAVSLATGDYFLKFENATSGDIQVTNLFVRLDPSSTTKRLLIDADCQRCDISGATIEHCDLSGRDFTGARFDRASLGGDDLRTAALSGASFNGTDLTDALFDAGASALSGQTVQKSWTSADGAYLFRFSLQYRSVGTLPQIALTILDSAGASVFSGAFDPDHAINIASPNLIGTMSVIELYYLNSNDDAGIYADLLWGSDADHAFHGVMITFDSFGAYPSASIAASLLDAASSIKSSSVNIRLHFFNQASSANSPAVVIFQHNVVDPAQSAAVAWRVFTAPVEGETQAIDFPSTNDVDAVDESAHTTTRLAATPGKLYAVDDAGSGGELSQIGEATSIRDVQVLNDLSQGTIDANLYKDGALLATKTAVAPSEKAFFVFTKSIMIGTIENVAEGETMDAATVHTINTEISLLGLNNGDIVMTGDGPGVSDPAYSFTLENAIYR